LTIDTKVPTIACACSYTVECWGKSCYINFSFVSLKCKISQYTPYNNYISGVKISGYFT
jgi:hypothetical protein